MRHYKFYLEVTCQDKCCTPAWGWPEGVYLMVKLMCVAFTVLSYLDSWHVPLLPWGKTTQVFLTVQIWWFTSRCPVQETETFLHWLWVSISIFFFTYFHLKANNLTNTQMHIRTRQASANSAKNFFIHCKFILQRSAGTKQVVQFLFRHKPKCFTMLLSCKQLKGN